MSTHKGPIPNIPENKPWIVVCAAVRNLIPNHDDYTDLEILDYLEYCCENHYRLTPPRTPRFSRRRIDRTPPRA